MTTQRTGVTEGRLELAARAARLRASGLTMREIGERLNCSREYASDLIHDPDGSKGRARKDRYRGTCESCGARTDGSRGRAKAPRICAACAKKRSLAPCGTLSAYHRGCRCDACREAQRVSVRTARERRRGSPDTPHGTEDGYTNWLCRCDLCRDAHSEYEWQRGDYLAVWRRRKRERDRSRAA